MNNSPMPPSPPAIQFKDVTRNDTYGPLVCLAPTSVIGGGLWSGDKPLNYSIPLFLLQLSIIVFVTRATDALLRPFRSPRYISNVLSGLLLGPTVFGNTTLFTQVLFPIRSVMVLETIAQFGVVYYIFTIGIELDVTALRRSGLRAMGFAMACSVIPTTLAGLAAIILQPKLQDGIDPGAFVLFLGVALSFTAFSALARSLGELKLVGSEIGRLALSAAIITDGFGWSMLALSVTLAQWTSNAVAAVWTVLSGFGFLCGSILVLKPVMKWVERRTPEGEEPDEAYACMLLIGVMVWAMMADTIGSHAIFGAFIYGLMVPQGPLGEAMIDMVEDFVNGLLMPLFFTISGLRTNFAAVTDPGMIIFLIVVIVGGGAMKIGGSILVAMVQKMPLRDGMLIGLLMNSKGVIELMVLNIAKDKNVLDNQTFAVLISMSVVLTPVVRTLLSIVVKPGHRMVSYKRRTVQWPKSESELRIVACVHSTRNVPSILALINAANPTKRYPIFVSALHLVELTDRTSAMLIVNSALEVDTGGKDGIAHGPTNLGRIQAQSEHIVAAFESYDQHAGGVSVQTHSAFSDYATMHEDVCHHAEEKHTALIILPFHKQRTCDGNMEVMHPAIRTLNQNVLATAPCSVGVLVDRGLGGLTVAGVSRIFTPSVVSHRVMILFIGGPDDREALAFASRMVGHPTISLTIFRFIAYSPSNSSASTTSQRAGEMPNRHERVVTMLPDEERERRLDDEHIADLRRRFAAVGGEVEYVEKVSRNTEETVQTIRQLTGAHDLYIVGRGQESPLTEGLTEWSEWPELGAIGDMLASSDFAAAASVLVLQRSIGAGPEADALSMPDSPGRQVRLYVKQNFSSTQGL